MGLISFHLLEKAFWKSFACRGIFLLIAYYKGAWQMPRPFWMLLETYFLIILHGTRVNGCAQGLEHILLGEYAIGGVKFLEVL